MAKEVTIEITQYCNYNCDYCSSNATINGKYLPKKRILKFLNKVKKGEEIFRINISGGEPISHPDFYEILMYCYNITANVWIYTNVIRQIIYNSDIVKELKVEANVCLAPGHFIYIPKNVNKVHLLKLVRQGRAINYREVNMSVSSNLLKEHNNCDNCNHILLQADGQIVESPCKKKYKNGINTSS